MAKPENLDDNNSVILVDGSSYVYRAYHALPPLTTSAGQPTGAVRGVVTMVMRILQDHPNAPVGMVFDAKGDTCLLYTSPSPRDTALSRMPSSA